MKRILRICDLGTTRYTAALRLQKSLFAQRLDGAIPDTLLLLEHSHVFTLGRNADTSNILNADGVEVEKTSRGGDVTYHGPGQLVGYPIVSLKDAGLGVSDYVAAIEDTIISAIASCGLHGGRDERNRGVWIGNSKIAAIGLRIRRGVSMHGFALNVSPDLSMYERIVPCGIVDAGVTSMKQEGAAADIISVKQAVTEAFIRTMHYQGSENVGREQIEET